MKTLYKNTILERVTALITLLAAAVVVATFILLYGFDEPLVGAGLLYIVQIGVLFIFLSEKIVRFVNVYSKKEFLWANWFEIPLLLLLAAVLLSKGSWLEVGVLDEESGRTKMLALGIYLILQVIVKTCRSCVNLAATGRNPAKTLIITFLVLIITGAGMLSLPRSYNTEQISFVDALFTATSATCVTGLIVKDTGRDFSFMGQTVILTLIQLGGLGIVIFGAVLALLLGQALSVRESVAMQDLLSAKTLGKISQLIVFIFAVTIIVEAIGAISLFGMWDNVPGTIQSAPRQWFCSIFHSISAFCNAGFSLFNTSMVNYNDNWPVYGVMAPLIILGGLGFGVLYNLVNVTTDKVKRTLKSILFRKSGSIFETTAPGKIRLQTKIVLTTSLILILAGTAAIMLFERNRQTDSNFFLSALFQSITARTAGFNTIDISSMTAAGKLILIMLMFIGGSPGSTAGGIKTVTFAVVIMVAYATLRKRREVEVFKRSVPLVVVGRAVTITLLFAAVFLGVVFLLTITESQNSFAMEDIIFETGSALGTVGLTTGITPSLTTAGKLIIIITMLIGRLGPLTLLASMTFNLRAVGYNYPVEPIVVG